MADHVLPHDVRAPPVPARGRQDAGRRAPRDGIRAGPPEPAALDLWVPARGPGPQQPTVRGAADKVRQPPLRGRGQVSHEQAGTPAHPAAAPGLGRGGADGTLGRRAAAGGGHDDGGLCGLESWHIWKPARAGYTLAVGA